MWEVDKSEITFASKWSLLVNFCFMSLCFSINHGCVTALIAAASTLESKTFAGVINGTLYSTYTISSLLFANVTLAKFGSKWTIFIGLLFYCGYAGSFLVAHYTTGDARFAIAVIATAVSGVGGGLLWTAQASFFNSTAKQYCVLTGIPFERATSLMTALFVIFYLGCEVILKIALSLPHVLEHKTVLFVVFTALSAGGAAGMLLVRSVALPEDQVTRKPMCAKVVAATQIVAKEPKIGLLAPYNFTFSFGAAFINQYANSKILEPQEVGYFAALLVGSGFFFSTVFGFINERTSVPKAIPMLTGSLSFLFFALCFIVRTNDEIAANRPLIFFMYITFGLGRGVWESTMKAVFADYFGGGYDENEKNAAFSHIPIQNGIMGATGFFLMAFADNPRSFAPEFLATIAVVGIFSYVTAEGYYRWQLANGGLFATGSTTGGEERALLSDEDDVAPIITPTDDKRVQAEPATGTQSAA
eukprot:m.164038 g.164038  ORF g.164038 m.164038 type:complete len:474 (+) comp12369_c0_seq1:96-1517(+)